MSWPHPTSIAVYIHWPFCAKKCPYCDFAVTVRHRVDEAAVVDALSCELEANAALYPSSSSAHRPRPKAHSIFFGGGTPSLMSPQSVASLVEKVDALFGLTPGCEISLEANPTDAESAKFRDFRTAGVNRLSLGVQSLDDTELMILGRNHSGDEARRALDITAATFENFSIDLMYALPRQDTSQWQRRVEALLAWRPKHVSLYQLTIEQGTVFEKAVQRGILTPFEDDPAAELYLETANILQSWGYPAYEVSNHAREGYECQHNLSYWRYQDYVGVGPGAHGRITNGDGQKQSTRNLRHFQPWSDQISQTSGRDHGHGHGHGHGREALALLSALDSAEEAFLMSMRTGEGAILHDPLCVNEKQLAFLMDQDMIVPKGNSFAPTPEGWLRLDTITGMLLT